MTAGADTFINEMMTYAGFRNVYEDSERYPAITVVDLKQRSPHYVLLSSEPYPFKEKHLAELQEELSETTVLLVDGEMFSWYGSRLLQAPDYFRYLHTLL
jgi:ABC-type Fe3+-hydroxamate transport system substrate-binding protein